MKRFGEERDALGHRWVDDPPTSVEAFTESDRLEQRWLVDLLEIQLDDTRPEWLRARHDDEDRRAALPDLGSRNDAEALSDTAETIL